MRSVYSDLGKTAVECFSNLCSNTQLGNFTRLADSVARAHTRLCPQQINLVLFGECKRLKLVQRIFSPGLVALGVGGQRERWVGDSPGGLDQSLVLLTLQDLQVHDNDLQSEREAVTNRRPDEAPV